MDISVLFYAALGGILPAIVWVWFWLKEDKKHPEPLPLIIAAFMIGMVAVVVVIPFEKVAISALSGVALILALAIIEEVAKFIFAYVTVLKNPEDNEPIDPIIYMITVAFGFAALENTLFLISPLMDNSIIQSILSGNSRFLGATLLHALSSSVIGVAMGLSFYKHKQAKILYTAVGLILAIALHATFNFLILNTYHEQLMRVFAFVWLGLILLLIMFERVKKVRK